MRGIVLVAGLCPPARGCPGPLLSVSPSPHVAPPHLTANWTQGVTCCPRGFVSAPHGTSGGMTEGAAWESQQCSSQL